VSAPVTTSAARERLLRTATALFYAEGLHAVGVDRIVTEAAVTRATFYRHFPGKEALVVAYLEGFDRAVRERVAGHAGAELVRAMTEGIGGEICRAGFRGCPFINAAAEHPDPADPVHRAVETHRDWLAGTMRDAFADAGSPEPEEAARRFVMLRDGAMVAGYLADAATATDTLRAAVEELLPRTA
jgi:AcrR family transcriptional regulator